jgi:predicted transcriptional regulator
VGTPPHTHHFNILWRSCTITITVTLSPDLEALLQDNASRQGREINIVASELLANALEWEERDAKATIEGIQQGLDDFAADKSQYIESRIAVIEIL